MNLRKALDILKYYGIKVLDEKVDDIMDLHEDERYELEDAIDKVLEFIKDMGLICFGDADAKVPHLNKEAVAVP